MVFDYFLCTILNREEMEALREIHSEEATGMKQKEGLVFIETYAWKEENPGKKVPTDKLTWHPVLQDDGSVVSKEGLWQKEGKQGHHKFERYRDARVTSSTMIDDGSAVICEGQQDRAFDLAAQELKIGKVMTLDDVCALPDVSDDNKSNSDKSSDASDSGTDDDEAERKEDDQEAKPLFRFMGRSAGPHATAAPKAKANLYDKMS